MTTPSSSVHPQALAERRGEDASAGSALVSLVHKQLAALESLAAEGYAEVSALHGEIADMTGRLNATVGRMARLEAMLRSHERMLGAIRAGLLEMPPPRQPQQQLPNGVQPAAAGAVRPVAVATPAASASQQAPAAELPRSATPASSPTPPAAAKPAAPEPPLTPAAASAPAAPQQPQHAPAAMGGDAQVSRRTDPSQGSSLSALPIATEPPPADGALETSESPADNRPQVQRGSTVEVMFEDNSSETYTLVRPDEANPTRNLIGDNTPLGMALLGACVGDVRHYRVRMNGPEQVVRVREIV